MRQITETTRPCEEPVALTDRDPTLLAVVVITRNEERHIGACLQCILTAIQPFPDTPVVVVDSDSRDATVQIAAQFPVTVYRYSAPSLTAAAGRQIGFARVRARYVLFIDGDCCLEADWLKTGIALLDTHPDVAVAHGMRHDVFEDVPATFRSAAPRPEEYGLGGNALYRTQVLQQVGGFNPFLVAAEEDELLGRILEAGYRDMQSCQVMITHYVPRQRQAGTIRRHYRGGIGIGQVLRLSLRQRQFLYHASRFNRYLITVAYLLWGVIAAGLGGWSGAAFPLLLWITFGALMFAGLAWRRRSLRSATAIVTDWLLRAVWMSKAFWQRLPAPEQFIPRVERIQ